MYNSPTVSFAGVGPTGSPGPLGGSNTPRSQTSRLHFLEAQNLELAGKLSLCTERNEDLMARMAQLEQQLQGHHQSVAIAEDSASTAEFHKQRLEAENKRLEQELEEARMRIRELEELEERSKKRVREEQSEGINWALTQVSESEQKMSRVHQQLRSLQTDKAVLEEKVQDAEAQLHTLSNEVNFLRRKNEQLESELEDSLQELSERKSRQGRVVEELEQGYRRFDEMSRMVKDALEGVHENGVAVQGCLGNHAKVVAKFTKLQSTTETDMSELNHQSKQLASISSSLQEEKRDLVRECRGKARALEQNASYIAELEEQLRLCREETKDLKEAWVKKYDLLCEEMEEIKVKASHIRQSDNSRQQQMMDLQKSFMEVYFAVKGHNTLPAKRQGLSHQRTPVSTFPVSSLNLNSEDNPFAMLDELMQENQLESFTQQEICEPIRAHKIQELRSQRFISDLQQELTKCKSEALDTISQLRVAISDAKDRSQELDSVFKHALESQAIQCRVSAALLAHGTSEVQMLENFLVELAENVDKETTSKNALIESLYTAALEALDNISAYQERELEVEAEYRSGLGDGYATSGGALFEEEERRYRLESAVTKLRAQLDNVHLIKQSTNRQFQLLRSTIRECIEKHRIPSTMDGMPLLSQSSSFSVSRRVAADNQTSADINVVQEFSEHFREHLLSVQHQQMEERSTLERMKVQVSLLHKRHMQEHDKSLEAAFVLDDMALWLIRQAADFKNERDALANELERTMLELEGNQTHVRVLTELLEKHDVDMQQLQMALSDLQEEYAAMISRSRADILARDEVCNQQLRELASLREETKNLDTLLEEEGQKGDVLGKDVQRREMSHRIAFEKLESQFQELTSGWREERDRLIGSHDDLMGRFRSLERLLEDKEQEIRGAQQQYKDLLRGMDRLKEQHEEEMKQAQQQRELLELDLVEQRKALARQLRSAQREASVLRSMDQSSSPSMSPATASVYRGSVRGSTSGQQLRSPRSGPQVGGGSAGFAWQRRRRRVGELGTVINGEGTQ